MNQRVAASPSVTPAEQAFLRHFNAETFQAHKGPALAWLEEQGLDWSGMAVFQRWGARHDQRSVLGVDEDPLPPFEVPWASREAYLFRVEELLELYPDLKPLMRSSARAGATA